MTTPSLPQTSLPPLQDSQLQLDKGVAVLTLSRHDVRNALTGTALVEDILRVADWVNQCDAVGALVITGGGSAFSAGGNVQDMAQRRGDFAGDAAEVAARYRRGIQRMPRAVLGIEVPVIAAVNGPAIGAGFDLANMCDIRLASDRARFGETFLNLGLIPGDGGAWLLQRLIGYQRACELTFSGRIVAAEEALTLGIVLDVCAEDALMPRALEMAGQMARQPRLATRLTKRLMRRAPDMGLDDFLDLCASFQGQCHQDPEHHAAVAALLAKMKV
ncbi:MULTISPECIES: enoyl-CoA hydratase-related protein [Cobetia]|uniref:Enoyl-CoA hydratase n=1 Tax=Cobetia crustatorum TaxID=553385 RepID=A0A558HEC1_9GAMM|nr:MULTISPECIES: enoyl-CoA hydratase-related protein [Cobetia]TVU67479.1 enoyl-CoA hydratase [Cobetia crustatorum]